MRTLRPLLYASICDAIVTGCALSEAALPPLVCGPVPLWAVLYLYLYLYHIEIWYYHIQYGNGICVVLGTELEKMWYGNVVLWYYHIPWYLICGKKYGPTPENN